MALVDEAGKLVTRRRIGDDADGYRRLLDLLAEAGEAPETSIPVAVETAHGLLFACLRATGRRVYSINPMAVARYRERHRTARAKSDHADAMTLANILRTDADVHRPLPADSELVQAIAVPCARSAGRGVEPQPADQPTALSPQAVLPGGTGGLPGPRRRPGFARGPRGARPGTGPGYPSRLTRAQLRAALRRSGRQRYIDDWVERLRAVFASDYLPQLPLVERVMGRQTLALVGQLEATCRAADDLAEAAAEAFAQHPDAHILTSFPGIGPLTGARVLGEIDDDSGRFADGRALKAHAGASPVTIASGKSRAVRHRRVKNQRLAAAGYVWIFGALPSPLIKEHYDRRRAAGDLHTAAMRNLFNRLLGCLFHCLQTGQTFDPSKAFPAAAAVSGAAAT